MVIAELQRIVGESSKAPEAIYQAEVKLAEAERLFEVEWNKVFLTAQGAVAHKEALSDAKTHDLKFQVDLCRAELNRVRNKAKQLEQAGSLVSTMAGQVKLTMRG